ANVPPCSRMFQPTAPPCSRMHPDASKCDDFLRASIFQNRTHPNLQSASLRGAPRSPHGAVAVFQLRDESRRVAERRFVHPPAKGGTQFAHTPAIARKLDGPVDVLLRR